MARGMRSLEESRAIVVRRCEPAYTVAVIFGEIDKAIQNRFFCQDTLDLMEACKLLLGRYQPKVRCRGLIYGERGKNIAPRSGLLNDRLAGGWRQRLAEGRFSSFELFAPRWNDEEMPSVYANFTREEVVRAEHIKDPSKLLCRHIDCSLTVAIRNDLTGLSPDDARKILMDFAPMVGGFFGFLIRDRGWGLAYSRGETYYLRPVDYQWHEYEIEYLSLDADMGCEVTRLYKGNLLSKEHAKFPRLEELPQEDVDLACEFAPGRYYIELKDDIYRFPCYREKWARYINLIPPGSYYFEGSGEGLKPLIQNFTA